MQLASNTALRAWLHKLNIAAPSRARSAAGGHSPGGSRGHDGTVGSSSLGHSRVAQYELGEVLNKGGFACVRAGRNVISKERIAARHANTQTRKHAKGNKAKSKTAKSKARNELAPAPSDSEPRPAQVPR